jgi:hypothetical protein
VALLLTDTTVVLQLTDRGLNQMRTQLSEDAQGTSGGVLARMLGAGLGELLDHGIAYRLSALRGARADGGRLVLEDHGGAGCSRTRRSTAAESWTTSSPRSPSDSRPL